MDVSSSCDENQKAPLWHVAYVRSPERNVGWRCYEDVPMKPGWISLTEPNAGAEDQELEFSMLLSRRGHVVVTYLRSYAGMGKASVSLKGFPELGVELDGAWASQTSQSDLKVIPVAGLLPATATNESSASTALLARGAGAMHEKEPTPQRVVVRATRAHAGKFKLLSMASC